MVHHYMEEGFHYGYTPTRHPHRVPPLVSSPVPLARPPRPLVPLRPFADDWCAGASEWTVAHRHEVERVFACTYREAFCALGADVARRLSIVDLASLLEAAAEARSPRSPGHA